MKTFWAAMATVLLAQSSGVSQPFSQVELSSLFEDTYDHPMVTCGETGIPDLVACSGFDEDDLDEDPLFPDCFLVTLSTQIYDCGIAEFRTALTEVAFVPSSEEDALAVARLYTRVVSDAWFLSEPSEGGAWFIPPEVLASVSSPSVARDGDVFTVEYFFAWSDETRLWFNNEDHVELHHQIIEVGPSQFTVSGELVWSMTTPLPPE